MAEDLSTPLSTRSARRLAKRTGPRREWRVPMARILFGCSGLIIAALVLRMVLVDDPNGGRPSAEAEISSVQGANTLAEQVSATPPADTPAIITPETASGPAIIRLDDVPSTNAPSPSRQGNIAALPDLLEETDDGAIPRVGTDGTTPFDAYRRPAPPAGADLPRIAIVVTGLGLNEEGTLIAIEALPEEVTLAFAPYGRALERTVAAARAEGHEYLLEIPMEPFDYPQNDPGPQTLLTGQDPRSNLDKLFWLMSRLGGYIGLTNHMGARFTASGGDFSPIMEELGTRGLGFLDDGSSNRSVAPQLATSNNVPFARVDAMLDSNPARQPILDALAALEAKARQNGSAVGLVSALPVSVSAISEWTEGLDEKGFVLVPVSAAMTHRQAP